MISTKDELQSYIKEDLRVQPLPRGVIRRLFGGRIAKMKIHLRKAEFYFNNSSHLRNKIFYYYHLFFVKHFCKIYCSEIPINVFGKGLTIWHPERIIINPDARVGDYCSLSSGVVIAQSHDRSPSIGNYVELMIDSKVLGGIHVADHVRIGADALVLKEIKEANTTWAGIPAKKINNKGTIEEPVPLA
ncbi:hypothetical protein [Bifidobacterium erythrocebi]|uniref:hypothetical protein n=1 Tax=Bifidobacterium erythrocebi TaxID=2675325 RepID=UPI00145E6B1C|nr:hypothetical protein [Bifidobacterium sp. DSM 109960]